MNNFNSLSNPPFYQFNWREVCWDNPFPNDLVALHELFCAVQQEHIEMCQSIISGGGTLDDIPSFSRHVWESVVLFTGFADPGTEPNEDIYEEFSNMHFAGSVVREDRLFEQLDDEQTQEYLEHRNRMHEAVTEMIDSPEVKDAITKIIDTIDRRGQEIDDLNKLFNESGE